VASDRLMRILRLLAKGSGSGNLCDVAADALEMSGAGIMFLSGDLPQGSACTTNGVSAMIEDLQYTLGEGPGVDAHRGGTAVLEPDLAAPILVRWPGFAAPALAGGAKAVFGFPVPLASTRRHREHDGRQRPGHQRRRTERLGRGPAGQRATP
jgi:hypothetical protein